MEMFSKKLNITEDIPLSQDRYGGILFLNKLKGNKEWKKAGLRFDRRRCKMKKQDCSRSPSFGRNK